MTFGGSLSRQYSEIRSGFDTPSLGQDEYVVPHRYPFAGELADLTGAAVVPGDEHTPHLARQRSFSSSARADRYRPVVIVPNADPALSQRSSAGATP